MAKAIAEYEVRDNVSLSRLHLDPENPRHDPIHDEDKIIAQLFKDERVLVLARDIAAKGGISPLERIGVIEMPDNKGHYIVAEGNRRACALKVLRDPKKAPTGEARKALKPLSERATLPDRFSIVVFGDREAARPWLSLRHLGAQDGAGIRPWNTAQKSRFARGGSPDHLALAIMDRAMEAGWVDKETRNKIALTTLTRYLGNPVVRAALGLGDRSKLIYTHDQSEVDSALRQFVADAIPRSDGKEAPVNSRSDKHARRAYAVGLHARGISPKTPLPQPAAPTSPEKVVTPKSRRNPRHPDSRPHVLPAGFVTTCADRNLQRLMSELGRLKPDDGLTFSANYVLRAVIERIMVLFAKKRSAFKPGMTDSKLTMVCHDELAKDGVSKNDLKNMRLAMSNEDALHSLHTLGSAVHGAHLPTRRGLIAVWDNWESALLLMLDRI